MTQKAESSESMESKSRNDESKPKEYAPKKRLEPKLSHYQKIAASKQLYGRPSENEFKGISQLLRTQSDKY